MLHSLLLVQAARGFAPGARPVSMQLQAESTMTDVIDDSDASQCWVDEQAASMLLRFGNAYESKSEKAAAYDALLMSPSAPRLLDAALKGMDAAVETSTLASRRWPVRLPSKRAALGAYSRALDAAAEGCDVSEGYEVYGDCRRSQLLDILRELKGANGPAGIYALEGSLPILGEGPRLF